MNLFKTKYRVIEVYKDGKLSDIYVEYKTFFRWKRLKFVYCGADIEFASGNLSFINSYNNPHKYNTDEWWQKEREEIVRLVNKWYIKPNYPKIDKVITNI